MSKKQDSTLESCSKVMHKARELFIDKNKLYGDTWTYMEQGYIADRMMVKCERISKIKQKNVKLVDEGVLDELLDIINYSVIGLMKVKSESSCSTKHSEVLKLYDSCTNSVYSLMEKKNHDYNDAWRKMAFDSILVQVKIKLARVKNSKKSSEQIEQLIIDELEDCANYAVFAFLLHQLSQEEI